MTTKVISIREQIKQLSNNIPIYDKSIDKVVQRVFLIISMHLSDREKKIYLWRFIQANYENDSTSGIDIHSFFEKKLKNPWNKLELFMQYFFLKNNISIAYTPAEIDYYHKSDFMLRSEWLTIGIDLTLRKKIWEKKKKQKEHAYWLDKTSHIPSTFKTEEEEGSWRNFPLNKKHFSPQFIPDTIWLLKIFNKWYNKFSIKYENILECVTQWVKLESLISTERAQKYDFISLFVPDLIKYLQNHYNQIVNDSSSDHIFKNTLWYCTINIDTQSNEISIDWYQWNKTQRSFYLFLPITEKFKQKINK